MLHLNRFKKFSLPPLWAQLVLFLLFHSVLVSTPQAQTSVTTSLNTNQISLNNVVVLTIDVQGARSANVTIPTVADVNFHPRGQSSQMQMINGSVSTSVSIRYLVQPMKAGDFTIPPISVKVGGTTHLTQPLSFTTSATQTSSQSGGQKEAELAFLRVEKKKDTIYTGEIIPVTIKAYFKQGMKVKLTALPKLMGDGFVMPPLNKDPQQYSENVNSTPYSVISWESSLSAVKEGIHSLVVELEANLMFPKQSRRSASFGNRSFFQDNFFDDFFGSYENRPVKVTNIEEKLEVKPLPLEGKPPQFSGTIGSFTLNVSANPTSGIKVGEPITLTMSIAGAGNFDRVTAPLFPTDDGWKTYSPTADYKEQGNIFQGEKVFEQAIVLKNGTIREIPPLRFTYFDPDKDTYITQTSTPIPIEVTYHSSSPAVAQVERPSKSIQPPTMVTSSEIEGLAPIKIELGSFVKHIEPLFIKKWFLALVALSLLLFFTAIFIQLRRKHFRMNPEIQQKSLRYTLLQNNLTELRNKQTSGKSKEFLAAARKTIQDQLGHEWGMEPSAITLDDIISKVPSSSTIVSFFTAAEKSAYGGFAMSKQEMKQQYTLLEKELKERP